MSNIEVNEFGSVDHVYEKVRVMFSGGGKNLINASDPHKNGKPLWGLCAVITKAQAQTANAIEKALATHHGFALPDSSNKRALRNGDKHKNKKTGEVYDGFEGSYYLKLTRHATKRDGTPMDPIALYGADRQPITDINDPRLKKDGCYANIQVNHYASKHYSTLTASPSAVVYRGEDFEPVAGGGGGAPLDENSMFQGTVDDDSAIPTDDSAADDLDL